ncbi:MAG: glycoside hydrolase family protein [Prochlorococcaceae cyanobacterium]
MAYPDPASGGAPWSIGYGHTGPDVLPGLVITKEQAEAWLAADVAAAAASVEQLLQGVALRARQRDALVSFCFNVGAGALVQGSGQTGGRPDKAPEGGGAARAQPRG